MMLPRVSLVEGEKAKFLLFSSRDLISNKLFSQGLWEDHVLAISKVFYNAVETPLILDIGANLGAYSIPIAIDIQNINGQVIAFEPQRIIFYQLCANVFINRLDNFYPINKAVSDSEGAVQIPEFNYEINPNIGAFSLKKEFRESGTELSETNRVAMIDTVKLDTFEVDRAPALIKIDVEGFEINVLKGSLEFLERYDYPPIIFEAWNFEWFANGKKELFSLFNKIGYTIFKIDETNFVAQHPKNPVAIDFNVVNNNIHMNRVR